MKAFQDDIGDTSILRIVWAICVLTVFFVWAWTSIKSGHIVSFEIGDATLIAFLFGGKVGQKYIEKNVKRG